MRKILILLFYSSVAFGQSIPINGNAEIFGYADIRDSLVVDSSVTLPGLGGTGAYVNINAIGRLSKTTAAALADTSHWTQSGTDLFAKDITWDVGIGILNPTVKLHVIGDFELNNSGWQLVSSLTLFGPGFPGIISARPQGSYQGITGVIKHPDNRFLAYVGMLNPNTGLTLGVAVDTVNIAVRSNNNIVYTIGNNMTAVITNDLDFTALNNAAIRAGAVAGSGDVLTLGGDILTAAFETQAVMSTSNSEGTNGFDANDNGANMFMTVDSASTDVRTWIITATSTEGRYVDTTIIAGGPDTVNYFNTLTIFESGIRLITNQRDSVGKGTEAIGYWVTMGEQGALYPHKDSLQPLGLDGAPWWKLYLTTFTSNTSAPPTDAELDALLGTPATVGEGAEFNVKDSDGVLYKAIAIGAQWFTFTSTLAP